MRYTLNALALWVTGDISFDIMIYGLRQRPVLLAGHSGAYVVDPDFE